MKELVLKHPDQISNLLGIVEIASKFAPSPVNTISELFFGQIRSLLGEIEEQRLNSAIQRILSGIDKDIEDGKDFNPNMVNLNQTNHRKSLNQELLEQVLRKCKDEPETKKQVFISNIYRNLVTVSTKEPLTANWGHKAIHIAEKMTYQQLILFRWHNSWVPHIRFVSEKDENGIQTYYGGNLESATLINDSVSNYSVSNYTLIRSDKGVWGGKRYNYSLTYADYIRLFTQGFAPKEFKDNPRPFDFYSGLYNPDRIILIDDYHQLKNFGIIEQSRKMKVNMYLKNEKDEFPCEFVPTKAGTHVFNLFFHQDDVIQIPSLNQDIEDLESIIIDPEVAKELENGINRFGLG